MHEEIEKCSRSNYQSKGRLSKSLTLKLAECMRNLNPPCPEEYIGLYLATDEQDDLESNINSESSQSLIKKAYNYVEIELTQIKDAMRTVVRNA